MTLLHFRISHCAQNQLVKCVNSTICCYFVMLGASSRAAQRWKWLFVLKDWCWFGVYAAETISLATKTGVIRSVDSPSTLFLTALVNIELNSLLHKPLMTSDSIFTWLHSSCLKATAMSWKLRNLINNESLHFSSDVIVLLALIQACYHLNIWSGSRFCPWWKHSHESQQ